MKGKVVWIAAGLILIAAIIAALLLFFGWGGQGHPATLIEAINRVDAHARPRDDWGPAVVGMDIHDGGQVRTGPASSARLELLEGSVRLSADSLFTVKEHTTRQGELVTRLFLEEGRLWAHLAPGQPHQFNVETSSAVAAVRDTHLSVKVAPDQTTLISVAEGEVEVTAQGEGVTVIGGKQVSVEPGQPPGPSVPLSDEERALWATEGEMPELAPPTPTPTPTSTPTPTPAPTLTPTATPVHVEMWVDVYCALTGPAGDPASRNPRTKFDATVQDRNATQVMVETPSGETVIVTPFGDIYGYEQRFHVDLGGMPQPGTYTFTALDADGTPIPGAMAKEVYSGGYEPAPPSNIRAEVLETGVLVTWDPSPTIPGSFDPSASPPLGAYQINLSSEAGGTGYGWHHHGRSLPDTSHLIPFRRQEFGPGDLGQALEEMGDGVYYIDIDAFSSAPEGTGGYGHECAAFDPAERIRIIVEGGQPRVESP